MSFVRYNLTKGEMKMSFFSQAKKTIFFSLFSISIMGSQQVKSYWTSFQFVQKSVIQRRPIDNK